MNTNLALILVAPSHTYDGDPIVKCKCMLNDTIDCLPMLGQRLQRKIMCYFELRWFKLAYTCLHNYNYTIILLSMLENGRSQFLLAILGRCLKLFISTESTSCHEFVSHFGLDFLREKHSKLSRIPSCPPECLFE